MFKRISFSSVLLFICTTSIFSQPGFLIFQEDFKQGLSNWVIEKSDDSTVLAISEGILEIIAPGGLTLWLNQKLSGNYKITFEALVVSGNKKYNRVSDLNCFWLAADPLYPDSIFKRSGWRGGIFGRYYSLQLFYAGYGGNNNTTTRFRKYNGDYESFRNNAARPEILAEYTDEKHLIIPDQWNTIEIIVQDSCTRYFFNGEKLFDYCDEKQLPAGYFGLRTVENHMMVKNIKIVSVL